MYIVVLLNLTGPMFICEFIIFLDVDIKQQKKGLVKHFLFVSLVFEISTSA